MTELAGRPSLEFGTDMEINTDFPIKQPADDALMRNPFALELARAFRNYPGRGSLVTALYGDWGSGKTSVKNLVVHHLRQLAQAADEPEPAIVDFNPWMFSSPEQITEQFFAALAAALPATEPTFNREAAIRHLKVWTGVLNLGAMVARAAGRTAAASGRVDPETSIALSETAAGGLEAAAKTSQAGRELAEAQAGGASRDLRKIRDELDELLGGLKRPIVVVIDDIDRLTAVEIRLVMQLVKANANFPKVVYFLLFERGIVVRALDQFAAESGERYLEKIVQVRLDMPRPDPDSLKAAFLTEAERLTADERIARRFSRERLEAVYPTGLGPYLHNLRRVYGLANSLAFHVGVFLRENSFDVDLNDLICLEALRLFEPAVYQALPHAKGLLTSTSLFLGAHSREEGRHGVETQVQALIPEESQGRRSAVLALLGQMFPQIEADADQDFVLGLVFGNEGLATLRIAHPAVFDRYFQFGVPFNVEPRREIAELLGVLSDRPKAAIALRRLAGSAIGPAWALSWLWQHLPNLDADARGQLLLALGDCYAGLADEAAPGVPSAAQDTVTEIVTWLLENSIGERSRAEALKGFVEQTADLRLQGLLLIRQETGDEPPSADTITRREEAHGPTVDFWLARVRQAAQDGSLAHEPALSYLLLLWERWAGAEEPRRWVDELITTPEGLVSVVVSCVVYLTSTDQEGQRNYETNYDLKRLEQLAPLASACALVTSLPPESLGEGWRREALELFQKICPRRAKADTEG